jgi:zinc transport system permease protein
VVGLILIISMLTIPPYMAERRSSSLKGMMVYSTVYSLIFSLAGLLLSYTFNLTSGASIISVSAVCFFASVLYDKIKTYK